MGNSTKSFSEGEWRVILSDPLPGSVNMAVDSAILAAVERNEVPTTLRLYSWDPPCLSLGYSQPYSDIDLTAIKPKGWDIVRRPTGGRAILHADELTYAVIGPKTDPILEGSLLQSYSRISQALKEALTILGLTVQVHQGKNTNLQDQAVCFEIPSEYEITAAGKKIIGSAQARKKTGILQHGSLPLGGDLTRITEGLHYKSPHHQEQAAVTLLEKAATVESILGYQVSWRQAADAFISGFEKAHGLQLMAGELTPAEKIETETLSKNKYNNPSWTKQTSPKEQGG
jgi:lipoate-protein ligase A